MTTKDKLENEIEKILDVLLRANLFFNDSKYFSSPRTDGEKMVKVKCRYLHEIRYSIWVLTVLELCKLFVDTDNHSFNLFRFLRKLKDKYKLLGITEKLDFSVIKIWENKLQSEDISVTITKLRKLRDEYYAHTDRNPDNTPSELTPDYDSITKLLDIAKEIVFDLKSKIFDIHQVFDTSGKILAGNLLNDLSELKQLRDKEFKRKIQELKNSTVRL